MQEDSPARARRRYRKIQQQGWTSHRFFQMRESQRALEKRNILIICILCVRRLITMMVKTVIGMTI